MPRPLAPCGTFSAYKRHCRLQEPVDAACAEAARVRSQERRDKATAESVAVLRLAVAAEPAVEDELDEIGELRENLRLVKAAMSTCPPGSAVALSIRRQELVRAIVGLEKAQDPAPSRLDELMARRSRRPAPDGPRPL
jgi:hypothetical protein